MAVVIFGLVLAWTIAGCTIPFSLAEILDGPTGEALSISPESAEITAGQTITLNAAGGVPPYTFAVYEGAGTIDGETGEYTAPSQAGTATIRVTDSYGAFGDATIAVAAGPKSSVLTISPTAITVMAGTSLTFSATGGPEPFVFTIASGTGTIDPSTGVYTAPASESAETIQVTDAEGAVAQAAVTVTTPGALTGISPSSITVGIGGGVTFEAIGGSAPYTFAVTVNNSGAPTMVGGAYTAGNTTGVVDTVRVTDNVGDWKEATVTVVPIVTNVNYAVSSVTNTGATAAGGPLDGDFTLTNSGSAAGSQDILWEIYVSTDDTIGGSDMLIDSGTTTPIAAGATSSGIVFGGFWPTSATTYYLICRIDSIDDVTAADNLGNTSVLVSPAPAADIDYVVQSITNSPSTADVGTAVSQSFTFGNQGTDPGVFTVYWTAYVSDDQVLDGGDLPISNGSESSLGPSTTSGSIALGGTWPPTAGVYYLIVDVSAGDDVDPSNDDAPSTPFTISAPTDIDYLVSDVSRNYPTVTSASPLSETFDLTNAGGLAGTVPIDWVAYASNDTSVDGGDTVIGSGTTPFSGLGAGATYSGLSITGAWPGVAGSYYLLVEVSAGDETVTGNNVGFSGVFTVNDPPDYSISAATIGSTGAPGTLLSDAGPFDFTIQETAGVTGGQTISWSAYVSTDTVLDGGDTVIRTGSLPPLPAGASSGAISFADATWPVFGSYYYVIVDISADDDDNSANNTFVSGSSVFVPELYSEGVEDNSDIGPTAAPLALISDLGPALQGGDLSVNELVAVSGTMDDKFEYDTYKMVLGPSVTTLDIYAEWSSGFDDIDLAVWDETGAEGLSEDWAVDSEPGIQPVTFVGLTPGATYYVAAKFMRIGGLGIPYSLVIFARP